jgi:PPOX class probable F420-dependent enzyme
MATVRPDGRPHVVPFVFALVQDGDAVRLYWAVDDKPKRTPEVQRLRNLEHEAAVEVVVDDYEEDWERLWWVRASGTGRVVPAGPERVAAVRALRTKYANYEAAPLDGPVLAIDVASVSGWTATRAP